eukprot:g13738.t1
MWCGVFTVTFAVHLYIDSSAKAAEAGKAKEERTTPSEANVTSQAREAEMATKLGKEDEDEEASLVGTKE